MRSGLDTRLAEFLKTSRRGEASPRPRSLPESSESPLQLSSALFRLEHTQQSITLRRLEDLLERLKCRMGDVFPEQFS